MKLLSRILISASSLLALASCDAMWDTSVDVPLGYGGSRHRSDDSGLLTMVGILAGCLQLELRLAAGVNFYVAVVRPPLRPGAVVNRPAMRPGAGVAPPSGNWRPPGNPGQVRPPVQKPVQPRQR